MVRYNPWDVINTHLVAVFAMRYILRSIIAFVRKTIFPIIGGICTLYSQGKKTVLDHVKI